MFVNGVNPPVQAEADGPSRGSSAAPVARLGGSAWVTDGLPWRGSWWKGRRRLRLSSPSDHVDAARRLARGHRDRHGVDVRARTGRRCTHAFDLARVVARVRKLSVGAIGDHPVRAGGDSRDRVPRVGLAGRQGRSRRPAEAREGDRVPDARVCRADRVDRHRRNEIRSVCEPTGDGSAGLRRGRRRDWSGCRQRSG